MTDEPHAYWASLHVVLREALPVGEGDDVATGYYWNLGVTAEPGRVREVVETHVRDGAVDWSDSDVSFVDPATLEPAIRSRCGPVTERGIWYQSGRAFHGPG